jgi:3-(3-hydroxy-phenyl)propionate hydroxylase
MTPAPAGETEVAIIGLGPVGATLAHLLAAQGLTVRVLEREPAPYPLPRAVHFDEEVMRVFQSIGLAQAILPHTRLSPGMRFVDAHGRLLLDWSRPTGIGLQGWNASYRFHQPALEQALRDALRARAGVMVETGTEVTGLAPDGAGVSIATSHGPRRARWVVGCDGARSFVRGKIGGGMEDLGFDERWLVVDVILRRPREDLGEHSVQFCDPGRPATYVRGVGERRRFEITLHPGEAPGDRMPPGQVWPLLARWITPEDAALERAAVYTFRSAIARRWRAGALLLAGDAAHLTPPFLGQGMCAGIRDAANLAWKLARVAARRAPEALLDSYQAERAPHARAYIEAAIRLGGLINTRAMAAALGDALEEGPARMESPAPTLGGFAAPLGRPFAQPILADGTRLDDRVGHRFAVLLAPGTAAGLAPSLMDALAARGAVLVEDDALAPPLQAAGAVAALVRPDRYLQALAPDAACVPRLLDHL